MASQKLDNNTTPIVRPDGTIPGGHRLEVHVANAADGLTVAQFDQGLPGTSAWPVADDGVFWASVWGVSNAPVQSADMTGGANVTGAPTAGQKIVIDEIVVSAGANQKLVFTEETSGLVMAIIRVAANGTETVRFRNKRKLAVADKKVVCTASATGNVEVLVGYHSEA